MQTKATNKSVACIVIVEFLEVSIFISYPLLALSLQRGVSISKDSEPKTDAIEVVINGAFILTRSCELGKGFIQIRLAKTQHLFCLHDNLSRCSPVFEEYSLFSNRAHSRGLGTDRFKFDLNLSIVRGG